eukprot:TRINITY_DN472_c0_g1_i1.p1 TRINITY_DN472_c0_g1~~TRINITY_DN472_c0_g1_i1.p1  ORF type:complete len:509 (+),score=89.37 TRINITY_DN472_c0_g1_i1:36-1529(+)
MRKNLLVKSDTPPHTIQRHNSLQTPQEFRLVKKKRKSIKKKRKQHKKHSVDESDWRPFTTDSKLDFTHNPDELLRKYSMDETLQTSARSSRRKTSEASDVIEGYWRRSNTMRDLVENDPGIFEVREGVFVDRVSGDIVSATLKDLVLHVVMDMSGTQFLDALLMVHGKLFRSGLLLKKFAVIFDEDHGFYNMGIKANIMNIITYWIDHYPFQFDDILRENVIKHITEMETKPVRFLDISELRAEIEEKFQDACEPLESELSKLIDTSELGEEEEEILHFDSEMLAAHITLIQENSWSKLDLNRVFHNSTQLDILSRECDLISKWVSTQCLKYEDDEEKCSQVIVIFLKVAKDLKELQNFCGFFSVFCGLGLFEVEKLTAWSLIGDKYTKVWRNIQTFCNPIGGYKFIKHRQEISEPPLIPQMESIHQKILYMENIESKTGTQHYNIKKINSFRELHDTLKKWQRKQYNISKDPSCWNFILRGLSLSRNREYLDSLGL